MGEIISLISRHKVLLIILVAAAFLRLWKISGVPVSLFGDELDVGYHAYSILKTGRDYSGNFLPLHFHSLAEWRTPLYLYSAVPTVALFGISPLGVRLPAAIFGILCVWGIYLLINELVNYGLDENGFGKSVSKLLLRNEMLALVAAFVLAISPWHIQYSRAAFEATELLVFLIFGLYFFFKSLRDSRLLWVSAALLILTPYIYSTAKLFTPLLLIFLFAVWKQIILGMAKSDLIKALITGLVIGIPIIFSTVFGGGAQRAGYISVFTDPTVPSEVGTSRLHDALFRKEVELGYKFRPEDRFFHNKVVFWVENITRNYLQSISADFLFIGGDPNLRHSINGIGQFYKIEFIPLVLGLIFFFTSKLTKKIKSFIVFWILAGIIPSAITRDGGNHATRLILMLPPLIFLISYGLVDLVMRLRIKGRAVFLTSYILLLTSSFVFYQHTYWVHYTWDSERWWHSGFKEAIQSIKALEKDYDKVILSMAGEPTWIFFAAWYQYPPRQWQLNFPIGNDVDVYGFGKISHIDKFYFGTFNIDGKSLYDLPAYLDTKTLYLAVAKEIGANLINEPKRTPPGLILMKAIPYPSGEPAYYLFAKQ